MIASDVLLLEQPNHDGDETHLRRVFQASTAFSFQTDRLSLEFRADVKSN
jgi:hypothetical protein